MAGCLSVNQWVHVKAHIEQNKLLNNLVMSENAISYWMKNSLWEYIFIYTFRVRTIWHWHMPGYLEIICWWLALHLNYNHLGLLEMVKKCDSLITVQFICKITSSVMLLLGDCVSCHCTLLLVWFVMIYFQIVHLLSHCQNKIACPSPKNSGFRGVV